MSMSYPAVVHLQLNFSLNGTKQQQKDSSQQGRSHVQANKNFFIRDPHGSFFFINVLLKDVISYTIEIKT